jgi:hypothetical protein
VTESATLEPVVIHAIERYFDQLQAHVSAQDMIEHVLTTDFETGFSTTISLVESRTVGVDHHAKRRPRGLSVGPCFSEPVAHSGDDSRGIYLSASPVKRSDRSVRHGY